MSILLSLQAVGAQTAEQMPDLTAVTAPTEAEINVIDLAFKGGWIMVVLLLLSLMACYIFVLIVNVHLYQILILPDNRI